MLEVNQINVSYDGSRILRNVSLKVPGNQVFASWDETASAKAPLSRPSPAC